MLWAAKPEAESTINTILETFAVRKVEEGKFRFCGKEVTQTDDFAVTVTCKDSAEQIEPIRFEKGKRRMTERATESEIGQMRSVVGSLGWVARQCRGDLSYEVSRGQSTVSRATIQDLKRTNEAVAKCREGSSIGITFQARAVDWNNAALVTIIDASFAQEEETNDDGDKKHHRSQIARLTALVDSTKDVANCHVISFASATEASL